MNRAAIYSRVSTEGQGRHGTSLQTQLEACRRYCAELTPEAAEIVLEASDTYSGATLSRQGVDSVLAAASDGTIDLVVCYAIDRSSRNLGDLLWLDRELSDRGVELQFVQDRRDRSPQGDLFFQIKGAFAEFERAQIMERARRGKDARVRAGQIVLTHRVAFGYTYNPSTRCLDVDDEKATIVRDMFRWYVDDGLSLNAIALRLTERGVPTSWRAKYWRSQGVHDILKNETYAGRYIWNKNARPKGSNRRLRPENEWISIDVPPIVSREVWQAAQSRFVTNLTQSSRNVKRDYLLRGMVYCGRCGRRLQSRSKLYAGYENTYTYYVCRRRGFVPASMIAQSIADGEPDAVDWCGLAWLRSEAVDAAVWAEVERQIGDPDLIRQRLEAIGYDDQVGITARADLERLASASAGLDRETDRLLDIYQAGALDRSLFIERMAAIKQRRDDLDTQRHSVERQIAALEAARSGLSDMLLRVDLVRAGMATAGLEEKRALLIDWSVRVTIAPDASTLSIHGLPLPAPCVPLTLPERRHNNAHTKGRR